jgi:hypothetical protein
MYGISCEVTAVPLRIVTTNVEKSAEAEEADCMSVDAKAEWFSTSIEGECSDINY